MEEHKPVLSFILSPLSFVYGVSNWTRKPTQLILGCSKRSRCKARENGRAQAYSFRTSSDRSERIPYKRLPVAGYGRWAVFNSLLPLLLIALIAHAVGCARQFPTTKVTPIKAANPAELQRYLLSRPDVTQFRFRGPFAMIERRDLEIPLDSDLTVKADLYLCAAASKAPLVIVLHGNNNSKEDHAFQAMHLASWGMHGLALDLPKRGPWIGNGRILAKLVDTIHRTPQLVDRRIDPDKIILVGHSFGATAVATALGEGAPALGGVLLDPTAIGRGLSQSLTRIAVPVMVIGADEEIWPGRNRGQFYRFIPRAIGEISIRDTVHEDAQYPNQHTLRTFEDDPDETEEAQIAFVSALTASAFGLAATGNIDYAWNSFETAFKNGMFFNARRK